MADPDQARAPAKIHEVLRPMVPLLVGAALLMGASGLLTSLIGLRATLEGFRALEIGLITSAYFAGFLLGAQVGASWIQRVGHVRAFAAFASIASMMVLIHVLVVSVPVWVVARLLVGACVAGLLVTMESWLNRTTPTAARGRVLSAYMVVNVGAYALAQVLLLLGPVGSFELFALVSIMLSAALLPVILSRRAIAEVVQVDPLPLRRLARRAPAATVASAMAGLTWGAIAGWSPVVAAMLDLTDLEITAFISSFMIGHLVLEPVVGAVSDRVDRRLVLLTITSIATVVSVLAVLVDPQPSLLIPLGLVIGGTTLPMYSLSIALAGDWLRPEEMVAASGTLVRLNGFGAAMGPLLASAATAVAIGGFYGVVALGTTATAVACAVLLVRAGYRPPRVPYIGMIARGSLTATLGSMGRAASTVRGQARIRPRGARRGGTDPM